MLTTLTVTGPIAAITINRPDARNALSLELLNELHAKASELAQRAPREGITVATLTGEGKAFCAGLDLKQVLSGPDAGRDLLRKLGELCIVLRTLPCTLVAAVNGPAVGGGCGLVTVCDLAITYTDNKMGFPEVDLGICPAVVAPWLVRKIGAGKARQVLLTGGIMSGSDAHALGIVSTLVPTAADVAGATQTLVSRLASGGQQAIAATKRLLNELDGSADVALSRRAAELSADIIATPETQEMLRKKVTV